MNAENEPVAVARRFGWREALIAVLLVALAALGWQYRAEAHARRELDDKLLHAKQEIALSNLSRKTAEFRAANREMETEVRRDDLDQRIVDQARRADELEREAEELRQRLLRETNCVTPKSIRNAEGL